MDDRQAGLPQGGLLERERERVGAAVQVANADTHALLRDGGTSRTTTTGQAAWLETYRLTEPKTARSGRARDRVATTS